MTAPLAQAMPQPVPKDTAAARKRRRRAAAGGASDDCFTCSKRNVKCDRRRPYCTQCLDIGKECSGYKTQLTWGVGVASRGKLRGLSLPIAKSAPVAREKKSPARARANSSIAMQHAQQRQHQHQHHSSLQSPPQLSLQTQLPQLQPPRLWNEHDDIRSTPRGPIDIPNVSQAASAPTTPYQVGSYDYLSMSHPESASHMPQNSWSSVGSVGYSPGIVHSPDTAHKYPKFPLALVTDGLSSSMDSVHSVASDMDYMSPMSQSFPREDLPFVNSPTVMYDSYHGTQTSSPVPQSPPTSIVIDHTRAPTSCPSLVYAPSEPSSSLHSHMDPFEPSHLGQKMMRECDNLSVPDVDYSTNHWQRREEDAKSQEWSINFNNTQVHINPDLLAKMPFFMDYYKNTICPSMVFIDGPSNPFRDHILSLAVNSQSLQHAICALSACNLRMKRRLSLGQGTRELSQKLLAEKQAAEAVADTEVKDQALSEEYQHRNLAVNLLNQQLNDPVKSSNDSVLATILLLCHYRMVECGIAKFHTQFAGVKKILSMRNQSFGQSSDAAWMESLFTYFDAISASTNEREAQLAPVQGAAELLPGIENFVGCDHQLFKTISKLGRLNLLSQHRPVRNTSVATPRMGDLRRSHSPIASPLGPNFKDSMGMYPLPNHRFDGNGFGSTLNEDEMLASAISSSGAYDEQRNMFWREWKEVRLELQNWQFDAAATTSSLPNATPAQIRDLGSLSEAFRYAALLYTERLASPNLPSNHTNFQNLVSQVVYYATSLESASLADKFLLWPLFVAGSECVNELQQNIIRGKCRDMMTRSGYMNNLAALDVLEQLWSGEVPTTTPRSPESKIPGRRGPFHWAKCIGGPGVDVEWIMF